MSQVHHFKEDPLENNIKKNLKKKKRETETHFSELCNLKQFFSKNPFFEVGNTFQLISEEENSDFIFLKMTAR